MNLYLISSTKSVGYDMYDSTVVAAKSESDAVRIHPNGGFIDWDKPAKDWDFDDKHRRATWVSKRDHVAVRLIGKAVKGTKAGVVCASFNAG